MAKQIHKKVEQKPKKITTVVLNHVTFNEFSIFGTLNGIHLIWHFQASTVPQQNKADLSWLNAVDSPDVF